ncbi:MAG: hypothetical protein GF405_02045 [Candidatus Eisenbacteria bacterium]|nr:hypothetical protein [Candidatus Eisenbacteria bacterium]
MRTTAIAAILVTLLIPLSSPANPGPDVYWFDDMESGEGEWTHEDLTALLVTKFHIDPYMAYDDPAFEEDLSWWCGTFEYDADGGYGNAWDQRLDLPTIQVNEVSVEDATWGSLKARYLAGGGTREPVVREAPRGALPVLTFAYRYDSEPSYDYTYVQVDSGGVWVTLNGSGWDGSSGGWQDLGTDGYLVDRFGSELRIRFRFISDGAFSDEDGLYLSDGGAFHVDNIVVYDHATGAVLFSDDCQTGGLCTPSVMEPAGDWWHIVDRKCPAYSDPHSWWCGDDADTSHIPPNLDNVLISPYIDMSGVYACTVRFFLHAEVPTVDNDYWVYYATIDGGATWHQVAAYWGDFEQCDGWGGSGLAGWDVGHHCGGPPFGQTAFMFRFKTTDNGCGPGAAGGAGIYLDDFWFDGGAKSFYERQPYFGRMSVHYPDAILKTAERRRRF